ncbi:hypothetical protein ACC870_38465, partial [Rhizobium ruizarguesonis]
VFGDQQFRHYTTCQVLDLLEITDLTSSTSAQKLLDGEQKLFDSRRSALIGMKSQMASRKDQLAEQVKGLVVQINDTED